MPEGSWSLAPTHSHLNAPAAATVRRPVLIYSPGYLDSDSWNTSKAEYLASQGYVVVGTDQLTELVRGVNPDVGRAPLPSQLGRSLDLSRIGMFGHSLGGSTTAQAMHDDTRISAGIDLDGPLWGSVGHDGLSRPLGMLGSQSQSARTNPDWLPSWRRNTGLKLPFRVSGSRHESFTDQEIILSQLRTADLVPASAAAGAIGSAPCARSAIAQNTFLRAFFDTTLVRGGLSPSDVEGLATSDLEPAA